MDSNKHMYKIYLTAVTQPKVGQVLPRPSQMFARACYCDWNGAIKHSIKAISRHTLYSANKVWHASINFFISELAAIM